ncbi:hypothetical protein HDU67_005971, partial [Dinochytrium kinnereticum]
MAKLDEELNILSNWYSPLPQELHLRENVRAAYALAISQSPHFKDRLILKIHGSSAYGALLPDSDIDMIAWVQPLDKLAGPMNSSNDAMAEEAMPAMVFSSPSSNIWPN